MKDWGATYQLVPPNVHRRNISERSIRTFKAQFLAILEGVDPEFPKYMWDNLLVQTELTINLLIQVTLNPRMSAWDWGDTYQLVPPNVHRLNISERAIRTFKAHFLSILAGVDPDFPKYTWENLLVQT